MASFSVSPHVERRVKFLRERMGYSLPKIARVLRADGYRYNGQQVFRIYNGECSRAPALLGYFDGLVESRPHAERCPGCGHKVIMPCVKCEVDLITTIRKLTGVNNANGKR